MPDASCSASGVLQPPHSWARALGWEQLPALNIWAHIAPDVGDLPGAEVGWPSLTPCRDIGVSAPQTVGSIFSPSWDISSVLHHLAPSREHKDESRLWSSAQPRTSKCALMPGVGITGQSWLDSALTKMQATLNHENSFISKMSLACFAFQMPYIFSFKGG